MLSQKEPQENLELIVHQYDTFPTAPTNIYNPNTQQVKKLINNWVVCRQPNKNARLRLFCFHHLGGSASTYRNWSKKLPSEIEVCAIQLPGRENFTLTKPITNFVQMTQKLVEALIPYLDKPFAFYGHSMGALIAFEIAYLLQKQYELEPVHLFVGGLWAPHTATSAFKREFCLEEILNFLEIPQILRNNKKFMDKLMPIFRADFQLLESYTYSLKEPLNCPIFAFGGMQDSLVSKDELSQWCQYTYNLFTLEMLAGQHMFLIKSQASLLKAISQKLIREAEKPQKR